MCSIVDRQATVGFRVRRGARKKDGFTIVGIHLEVLVLGESTSNLLEQCENKVRLRDVIVGQRVTQGTEKLFTPWLKFGTAENMPVGFDNVDTGRAFICFDMFDPVHVSLCGCVVMRKFDDEDLGTVV
jgi:hypothetical protein